MSAIATKIVGKYNLTPGMSTSDLSKYTSELLKDLTDDRKRNQARRRLRDGFKFSDEKISILIPTQKSGRRKVVNLTTLNKVSTNSDSV
ncbi:5731_t:CDS:1, partial [Paraglomus occultum]